MYSEEQRKTLLDVAKKSIAYGLENGRALPTDLKDFDDELREERATFVTLKIQGNLRGCIGVLETHQALVTDVSQNAYSAAYKDPRFSPLSKQEYEEIDISISVLGIPETIKFNSEDDLLSQIRPGVDGLILEEGWHRGTFLPAVWESIKTPKEFLTHLKQKAGLPANYWSDTIKIRRYVTESW